MRSPAASTGPKRIFVDITDMSCKPAGILTCQIARYARECGFDLTPDPCVADVIVLNTCAVDRKHEDLTLRTLDDLCGKRKPGAEVVTVGCLNAIDRDLLERRYPGVRVLRDGDDLRQILGAGRAFDDREDGYYDERLVDFAVERGPQPVFKETLIRCARALDRVTRDSRLGSIRDLHIPQIVGEIERTNRAYVLIGRGCAGSCSYCAIKIAQGKPRSRSVESILADARRVCSEGKVLCLAADDCASYGLDIGETFPGLVRRIDREMPGVAVDIGYLNPRFLETQTDEYLGIFADCRINAVNVPLQSGSDRIVRMMDRKYAVRRVIDVVDRIKRISPATMLWTHCIVGFPSETWGDYMDSLRALDHFHYYNVFTYSSQKNTRSASLDGQVPRSVVELRARLAYLRYVDRMARSVSAAYLGVARAHGS